MPFIALALVLAAAIGGGTALAAENALPGDPLWHVKVSVNEGLSGLLAQSPQAQAEQDIADIKARVSEMEQLEAQGSLNADTQAQIAANFDAHVQDAKLKIDVLQKTDPKAAAEAAADFQAAMAQGAATLGQAAATQTNASFLSDIRTTLDEASALSADTSAAAAAAINAK